MNLPELYYANNHFTDIISSHILKKYKHLININKDQSILEIGTGDGKTTATAVLPNLQNGYKEFVLSDKSEIMLEHAKKMPELSNLEFIKLDIEDAIIPEGFRCRFSHIISFFALHWITDVKQAVQNIYDMLIPGGVTFCVLFTETPVDYAYRALSTHPKWSKYKHWVFPHCHTLKTVDIFQESLSMNGFKNYFLEPFEYVHQFSSEQEVRGLYTSVNCNLEKIPQELRQEYLEDYFGYFKEDKLWSFEKSEDGQNSISIKLKLVILYAEKQE